MYIYMYIYIYIYTKGILTITATRVVPTPRSKKHSESPEHSSGVRARFAAGASHEAPKSGTKPRNLPQNPYTEV